MRFTAGHLQTVPSSICPNNPGLVFTRNSIMGGKKYSLLVAFFTLLKAHSLAFDLTKLFGISQPTLLKVRFIVVAKRFFLRSLTGISLRFLLLSD
jgi:hypothetical protein